MAIRLTQELVRIPSPYGDEGAVGRLLASRLTELGLEAKIQEVEGERCNIIAILRGNGGGQSIILQGHMDTMPVFGMEDDPFSGKLIDGGKKIFGRGATDMKGALACMMVAADLVKNSSPTRYGDLILAFTVDEESQKKGIFKLMGELPRADMAICGEPTSLKLAPCQKGNISVKLTTFGKQTHGSTPEKGINAIMHMAHLLLELGKMSLESVFIEGIGEVKGSQSVGIIQGGHHFMFVPDTCHVWMDRRLVSGGPTQEEVINDLRALIGRLIGEDPSFRAEVAIERQDFKWEPIIRRGLKPFVVSLDSEIVKQLSLSHRVVTGQEVEIFPMAGWTEADFFNEAGIPTVLYGPGHIYDAHSTHEAIEVSQLEQATAVYADLVTRVVCSR